MIITKLQVAPVELDVSSQSSQSSSSCRASRAVLFDQLDTAKMHGLDTSNVSSRVESSRAKWNLSFNVFAMMVCYWWHTCVFVLDHCQACIRSWWHMKAWWLTDLHTQFVSLIPMQLSSVLWILSPAMSLLNSRVSTFLNQLISVIILFAVFDVLV